MVERLDFKLVFCEFDETMGPISRISFPKIETDFGNKIATKSINILSEESYVSLESLAFLPFPVENKKSVVRNIEWKDYTMRGGTGTGALTLLFDEADDLIFYKYVKDLEVIFNAAAEEIIKLKSSKADNDLILGEIKIFHDKFRIKLDELCKQEMGPKDDSEAFPDESDLEMSQEYSFKVVVCGDPACGKTSAILRFTDAAFRRTYLPTMGVDITKKEVNVKGKNIFLMLWDIAGQMKYKIMRHQFYYGAKAILLLYDITRHATFQAIPDWYRDIKQNLKNEKEYKVLLCGNKVDLKEKRQVTIEEAQKLADELNMKYLETSALTGENINEAFHFIAKSVIDAFELAKLV